MTSLVHGEWLIAAEAGCQLLELGKILRLHGSLLLSHVTGHDQANCCNGFVIGLAHHLRISVAFPFAGMLKMQKLLELLELVNY